MKFLKKRELCKIWKGDILSFMFCVDDLKTTFLVRFDLNALKKFDDVC